MNKRITQLPLMLLLVCVLCFLASCAPRGETKTLDQVLADAKAEYTDVQSRASGSLPPAVTTITSDVEKFVSATNATDRASVASKIESGINQVIPTAGYTSRAALTELMKQYRAFAADTSGNSVSASASKMLVARTYLALASELRTTNFEIK